MFEYNIHPDNSYEHFKKACKYVEDTFGDNLVKERLLVDVDGTQIQVYNTPKGEIKIFNDTALGFGGWVCACSDFEINNPEWKRSKFKKVF